jgi:CheY-like chemotaxis protein
MVWKASYPRYFRVFLNPICVRRRNLSLFSGDRRSAIILPHCNATRAGKTGRSALMVKILIVEDEPIVAAAVSQFLDHAGHQVVGVAKDEASALRQAAAGRPDLVLMDVRLAGASDGIETARKIQAERPVNVVFMTAYHDSKTRARAAAAAGPAAFVPKPFSCEDLLKAVSAATLLPSKVY